MAQRAPRREVLRRITYSVLFPVLSPTLSWAAGERKPETELGGVSTLYRYRVENGLRLIIPGEPLDLVVEDGPLKVSPEVSPQNKKDEFHTLLNQFREERGLALVERWELLDLAAQDRIDYILQTGRFSHRGPQGEDLKGWALVRRGASRRFIYGELLGRINQVPEIPKLTASFLTSCTHRNYFEWKDAPYVGIAGGRDSDGVYYLAAIFAGGRGSSWPSCQL